MRNKKSTHLAGCTRADAQAAVATKSKQSAANALVVGMVAQRFDKCSIIV